MMDTESPYLYLCEFEEIYATINLQNFSKEQLKLKLYVLSMRDKPKMSLHSLHPKSIGRGYEMKKEFLKKFLLSYRTNYLLKQIVTYH